MQKPFLSTQSQFQLMSPQQQQQFLAQAQAQGNLSNSSNYGDIDPRRFTALTRGGLNGKDGQPAGTDGCISSPMQSSSPKVRPDQEYLMKVGLLEKCAFVALSFSVQVCILRLVCWNLIYLETSQMQQTSSQQPQEQLQQQQQQQSQQQQMQQVLAHISCSAFESWFKWTPC
jgi:hypothetical protein